MSRVSWKSCAHHLNEHPYLKVLEITRPPQKIVRSPGKVQTCETCSIDQLVVVTFYDHRWWYVCVAAVVLIFCFRDVSSVVR